MLDVEPLDGINPLYRGGEDAEFDKTQCREGQYTPQVSHRDYLGHCERWDYVLRSIRWGQNVLDVGCGQDVSLCKALGAQKSFEGNHEDGRPTYTGCDLNKVPKKPGSPWVTIRDEFNFLELCHTLDGFGTFDVAVNLEVIEHMLPEHGADLLTCMWHSLKSGGVLYLSTPCFNGKAAKNHIHEYTIEELGARIQEAGFVIEKRYGVFASYPELKKGMLAAGRDDLVTLLDQLREFHSLSYLSGVFAPMFPDYSRNNLWVCRKP